MLVFFINILMCVVSVYSMQVDYSHPSLYSSMLFFCCIFQLGCPQVWALTDGEVGHHFWIEWLQVTYVPTISASCTIINPRTCAGWVTIVVLSICLSTCVCYSIFEWYGRQKGMSEVPIHRKRGNKKKRMLETAQTFCSKVVASFNSPLYVRMSNGTTPAHCTCMMSMSAQCYCILYMHDVDVCLILLYTTG